MAATLKDVADRAGVSRSAVSRAFTQGASVSATMRRRVEYAAEELGYSPNVLARSLTTGQTKMIGLVTNNFHNPIFLQVFDLFTRGLQSRDLRTLLINLSDETDPENSVRLLRQYSVDGVIVASSTLTPRFSEEFKKAGIPVVNTFGRPAASRKVHTVGVDNVAVGEIAARTLIARGYKSLGFLGGPQDATSTLDRQTGFRRTIDAHPGITLQENFATDYSFDAGRAKMQRLLGGPLCDAYFCGDDVISIGALSALQDAGVRCPEDVGIIGMNDMELARWECFSLTTIHQPVREIISSSIELIVSMLDEPDRYPEARVFPCTVIERGTLRPMPPQG